jgi:hypothetical protein
MNQQGGPYWVHTSPAVATGNLQETGMVRDGVGEQCRCSFASKHVVVVSGGNQHLDYAGVLTDYFDQRAGGGNPRDGFVRSETCSKQYRSVKQLIGLKELLG